MPSALKWFYPKQAKRYSLLLLTFDGPKSVTWAFLTLGGYIFFFWCIQESFSYVFHNSSGYKKKRVTLANGCSRTALCKKVWRKKLFSRKQSREIGSRKMKNAVISKNENDHHQTSLPFAFFPFSSFSLSLSLPSSSPHPLFPSHSPLPLTLYFYFFLSFYLSASVCCGTEYH